MEHSIRILFSYFTASMKLPDSKIYKLENTCRKTYPAKNLEFSERFYLKQLTVISSLACPYPFSSSICLLQTSCLQQSS